MIWTRCLNFESLSKDNLYNRAYVSTNKIDLHCISKHRLLPRHYIISFVFMRLTFADDIFAFENKQYKISTNNSCGRNIFLHDKYMIPYIFSNKTLFFLNEKQNAYSIFIQISKKVTLGKLS